MVPAPKHAQTFYGSMQTVSLPRGSLSYRPSSPVSPPAIRPALKRDDALRARATACSNKQTDRSTSDFNLRPRVRHRNISTCLAARVRHDTSQLVPGASEYASQSGRYRPVHDTKLCRPYAVSSMRPSLSPFLMCFQSCQSAQWAASR